MAIDDINTNPQIPKRKKRRTNPGFSVTPGMHVPVPIKMDRWSHIYNTPAKTKPRNKANKGYFAFVDFTTPTLPEVTIDKWFVQSPVPRRKKVNNRLSIVDIDFIEAIQSAGGDFFDTGAVAFTITPDPYEAQTYLDNEAINFTIVAEHVEDFQLEDTESINFTIKYPDTGNEIFNIGIPGFISVNVFIDTVNESNNLVGQVQVTREDNTAARFSLAVEFDQSAIPPKKPVELINKIVSISFASADMLGVVADYIPIFVGICKRVSFNEDQQTMFITGYDYGGVHQTKGEFISDNITSVFEGAVYANSATTITTGHSPIWGVTFNGNKSVVDGQDYFVNTLTGQIIIPISSRVLQFPGSFSYNYMNPFSSMRAIIQGIAGIKSWILKEDNVTIADYSSTKQHPVLSLSDESVIDTCRKFLELSGAKIETNLFPTMRVYSEVQNFLTPVNTITIDESIIFEDSLTFDIDFDGLLNEQTVRSVQKVNANINIGNSEILATYEGSQGTLNPNSVQGGPGVDYTFNYVLVEKRLSKQNIASLSFEASGQFSFFTGFELLTEPITASSWSYFVDGDDFVIQLKHKLITSAAGTGGVFVGSGSVFIALPAVDYELTVNGTKINYGDGAIEDVKVVTVQRPIVGISQTLAGDVYENPYIETNQHCANIGNAILLEHGNPYDCKFEMPLFEGKEANIGDKIEIHRDGLAIFAGIIKMLGYSLDVQSGVNTLTVGCRGVGRRI